MASSPSCSHWWHAPVYITIAVAFVAISRSITSPNNASTTSSSIATRPIIHHHPLSSNASTALRRSGFNIVATLLQISPEIFFSSPNTTIFAIRDSSLTNTTTTSVPPWFLKHLLQYHTSPLSLSMDDLLKKPQGSCFSTLLWGKSVAVTKVDAKESLVEINGILVSHPDIFLGGNLAVHGVLAPFSSIGFQELYQGWDSVQAPICDANSSLLSVAVDPNHMVEWNKIIHLLSSHGFISFAVGLNSVLDQILEDHRDLTSVTIFSPPDRAFVASSSSVLEMVVRYHILPQRTTYQALASLSYKQSLKTLLTGQHLEITRAANATRVLSINGVEIVAPNIVSSKKYIVHGVSRAFDMEDFRSTST